MKSILFLLAICFSLNAQDFIVDTPVSTTQVTATHITAGTVSATGNVSADKFIGDGSLLMNVSAGSTSPSWYAVQNIPSAVQDVSNGTVVSVTTINSRYASFTTINGGLSTPAQPNVTSVGTLTGLTVSGNSIQAAVSATNVSASGNVSALKFIGDGSLLTNLPSGGGGTSPSWYDVQNIPTAVQNVSNGTVISATAVNGLNASLTNLVAGKVSASGITSLTTAYVATQLLISSPTMIPDVYGPCVLCVFGADATNIASFSNKQGNSGFRIYVDQNDSVAHIALGAIGNESWAFTTNNGTGILQLDKNTGIAVGNYAFYNGTYVAPPAGGAIFSGNVGIGTSAPSTALTVVGAISSSNIITVASNVGTCNTAARGSIRYSSVSNTLQFCNGTGWKSLSPTTL